MRRISANGIIRRIIALGRKPVVEPSEIIGAEVNPGFRIPDPGEPPAVCIRIDHEGGSTLVFMEADKYLAFERCLAKVAQVAFGSSIDPFADLPVPRRRTTDADTVDLPASPAPPIDDLDEALANAGVTGI